MTYKILIDYGAYEGLKFQDPEFATVDAAVKHALSLNYGQPFLIVQIIDWKAQPSTPPEEVSKQV